MLTREPESERIATRSAAAERDALIHQVRERLQRQASPRMHMFALVSATAACGLLTSFALLKGGLTLMPLRYPLAVGVAYLGFLGLVKLWLRRFRLRARERADSSTIDFDVVELPIDSLWNSSSGTDQAFSGFGDGGGFGGGGAARSWGDAANGASGHAGASGADGGGGGFSLDEGAAWLIPVAIVGALATGVFVYVIYVSPALFAEMLLDAGLAAGLYRRLTRIERRSWLVTAVRNTIVPAAFVAGLLAIAGGIMHTVYPDAPSIGPVVQHLLHPPKRQSGAR